MVLLKETITVKNGTTAFTTTYNNTAIDNFEELVSQQVGGDVNDILGTVNDAQDTLYNILDLYVIQRYFYSDPQFIPVSDFLSYDTSFSEADYQRMYDIFITRDFSVFDMLTDICNNTQVPSAPNYEIYSAIQNRMATFFDFDDPAFGYSSELSEASAEAIDGGGGTDALPLYNFFLNEAENVQNRIEALIAENGYAIDDEVLENLSGKREVNTMLMLLEVIPTCIRDKRSLQEQIEALQEQLNDTVNRLTATIPFATDYEAVANVDFLYVLYINVFGNPTNGIFDARKLAYLRTLTVDEISDIVDAL